MGKSEQLQARIAQLDQRLRDLEHQHRNLLHALELSPDDPTTTTPASPQVTPSKHGGTVLLADDEPYVRSALEDILSWLGLTVHAVDDGRQALDMLARLDRPPNVVMLDVKMPGLNGMDTLVRLRERHPTVPVLLMSAHSEAGEQMAREDDHTWFLQKPFGIDQVQLLLEQVL